MIGEWDESVLYLLKNGEVVSALLLSAALYHYGLLGGEDNLFVTCLLRVIRNPSVKPLVAGALIGVVREAGINETFGYQIFTGARRASRDNLLKIAFAMGCTLREANRLLQAGGANELYCKNRRDAIVIFAISHGYTLQKTEEELYRFDEATIS